MVSLSNHEALRNCRRATPSWFDKLTMKAISTLCPAAAALAGPRGYFRATISFLISAMALAGFKPLGQVRVQFMMVWQR